MMDVSELDYQECREVLDFSEKRLHWGVHIPWFNSCLLNITCKIGAQEVGQLDSSQVAEICYYNFKYVVVRIMNDRNACDRTMQDKGTLRKHFQCTYLCKMLHLYAIESNQSQTNTLCINVH